jgi:Lipocalin-like domain
MTSAMEADLARRVVGTYRLISFENFADDGEVQRPFGDHPRGFAMYTPEGYMSAILMRSDRANFPEGDILGGGDRERVEAFATASAYAGRWEVVGDRIVHHLEATTYPNWTDTDQYRNFDATDTHFTLYPPRMLMQGKIRRGRVHFARILR